MEENPPIEEPKRRRRWWPFFAVLAVLVLAGAATFKAVNRSEFSFLADLGPTHVVDPGEPAAPWPGGPSYRFELFYFDRETAPKVAAAIKRELTKAKGFAMTDFGTGKVKYQTFSAGKHPEQYGAMYTNLDVVASSAWKNQNLPKMDPEGVVVVIFRGPTWFEAKWTALKEFLHLN